MFCFYFIEVYILNIIFNIPYYNYIIIALFITIKIYNVYNKNLHRYIITTVGKWIAIKKIKESRKGKEKRNNII